MTRATLTAYNSPALAVDMPLGEGQPVADDDVGTSPGQGRLDEAAVLGGEDLTIGGEVVGDQGLAVAESEVADKGALGPLGGPLAEEMRYPGDL